MLFSNSRLVYNEEKAAIADAALMPICVEFSGMIETRVKEYIFEVGNSATDFKEVSAEEYIAEISTKGFCKELIDKEIEDIEILKNGIYLFLVDFPKGKFRKASERVFATIKGLGYSKVIIDDYNRSGKDIWGTYGFSGKYLDDERIKTL
ncbi:hypothetical protein UFOVP116_111 [uncultured Caudovirales phage]|uniref:Uncharacterized protein n=1 Tax=uncultured Caudovirales phage TaxID=2100421 RepID=A0A6J5L6P8_9CAUD|nr:hypothetical protein UFOVP116_111 [uncultured Caudovirales phage]